ncbi:2'-5' RNA ligase family protein [Nocardioides jiangxiensis]|uniref:2'-5' RNA ligase family protein n=1 Tax=Nocardioides jiangxiensis TaxID=3064524 RepID=A0ABT9AZK0_9ACTN|nr:2'-5' RNA ligase family protein [Nocardioides sp. WY-20]MDO7867555.1 2'-5' RNA ligase family protein [Nocardioides sp. WY-20]
MPTIGVSIALPEPWATELQEYRQSIGDLTAAKIPTHITLVPPTEVDDLETAEAHLAAVTEGFAAFRIHLRGTGTFRPVSPVVFVNVVEGIAECELLYAAVRRGPLAGDSDFPYHPHVTIGHHLDDSALDRAFDELATFDGSFIVNDVHLYVHDEELGWRIDRSFPLEPVPLASQSIGAGA